MDLTVRYQLRGPGLELVGTARNLSNAPEVGYQGNPGQYDLHVLTGRTFDAEPQSSAQACVTERCPGG